MSVLVNGRHAEMVPVRDRGLHYGDGLFETIRVAGWKPALWQRHMDRLLLGCERLGMDCPSTQVLRQESEALIRSAGLRQGVLKIIISRGSGGRGYLPPAEASPLRVIMVMDEPAGLASWRREGMNVGLCRTRAGLNPDLAGLKHLNRLEQVMASRELEGKGFQEGLIFDIHNKLIEGTRSNIFLRHGHNWRTPDLNNAGVAGILRGLLLEVMQNNGINVDITAVVKEDLISADEIILTNSLFGVCPVRNLEGRQIPEFRSAEPAGGETLLRLLNLALKNYEEAVY